MVVKLAAKCLYFILKCVSSGHFYSAAETSVFEDCNFLFIHDDFLFGERFVDHVHVCSGFSMLTSTRTHVPTPCSLPAQSLVLPLHAPFPSILFSLTPPYWPSPSNHMIIWHNVTPPDA